ncbi:MAG TPA: alanine/glycine:cation symporter family protein [Allosphingosinicella sp.]|jgi:AGCS family alanine or glycine:cation symporter|nr:alanine/glycine:cation symporter family protein [Allosphingosinicella sp.]
MAAAGEDAGAAKGFIDHVTNVSDFIWGGTWNGAQAIPLPPMILILLGIGLYMMVGLRFYPILKLWPAFIGIFRKSGDKSSGEISPFAALSTALSGQVGTGNLAGVATAIALGGPGAIFWMWITALIGMALAFAEGALAIRYRERTPEGTYRGGPMSYIAYGLGPKWKWLAILFSIGTLISAVVTGNMIQANSVGDSFQQLTGYDEWIGGLIIAFLVFVVIIGGIKSIGAVAEKVVPTMAALYLLMALIAILINIEDIPETFGLIFSGAFNAQSATGGFLGAAIVIAMRAGVARGLFSNEAGQGSTPIAHAVARTTDPALQGRFAMMGTFIDTILVCTMTALVILTVQGSFPVTDAAGAVIGTQEHAWSSSLRGFDMTAGAFSAAFPATIGSVTIGALIASIALLLFVFTTLLTWSYYGERAITYLYDQFSGTRRGERQLHMAWRMLWCVMIWFGSFQELELVWRMGDIANAAMALPNLIALAALSGVVFALARGDRSAGPDHGRETPRELLDDPEPLPAGEAPPPRD